MAQRHAIFAINLLQDVNILRALVFMAARDLGLTTELLVSGKFVERDSSGIWQRELGEICDATGAPMHVFQREDQALYRLQGKSGILVAATETNLSAHAAVHEVFRLAPPSLIKITVQHGFECMGLLQSLDHDKAHGREVVFAADVVCGWYDGSRMSAMLPSQRSKLYVAGPPAVLQARRTTSGWPPNGPGLVCENMHSVRLNTAGDFKTDFMEIFESFCAAQEADGRMVTLRPHPGGQYVLKNKVVQPGNVTLNNNPIYKVDLSRYGYGISAPSTVVIDMILADIPVAIWRDAAGVMCAKNYEGLTEISSLNDWLEFSREALAYPGRFIEHQRRFLERQQMPYDPAEVYRRYAELFLAATRGPIEPIARPALDSATVPASAERVLFIANDIIPTLQLSFIKPLAPLVEASRIATDFLTEEQMKAALGDRLKKDAEAQAWLEDRLEQFGPTLLVFCRYSGPQSDFLTGWAMRRGVPVIYHLDDDLLNVPPEIGARKYASHNHPSRLGAVRHLLDNATLVYCSTSRLKECFQSAGVTTPMVAGQIYCSGQVLAPAVERPVRTVGYMGFDHAHDFAIVVPTLVQYLHENPDIQFELFGSIPKPPEFEVFGDRISLVPPIRAYEDFLSGLARLEWDIGICPLAHTPFNLKKANTKWVEYTSVGTAVIASSKMIYDDCCADGCGILADSPQEWLAGLNRLTRDPKERAEQVRRAQKKLTDQYSTDRLRRQILTIFGAAEKQSAETPDAAERNISPATVPLPKPVEERILFISNNRLPTLQLSFIKPLAPLTEAGNISIRFLHEGHLKDQDGIPMSREQMEGWLDKRYAQFKPTLVVFCRYNGPNAEPLLAWIRRQRIPAIYHIDDNLLDIPADIGLDKANFHNAPVRVAAVRHLLHNVDLIYCSTRRLMEHFRSLGIATPMLAGQIYCSGGILIPATSRPVQKFGYMASADHEHNLRMIMPAIIRFMRHHPAINFELFGSIPRPADLAEFGDRVSSAPPISNYEEFLKGFSQHKWDVGICPLTKIQFNLLKSNTKWVEYTSVGAAVIASKGTVYDDCCAEGCGILADSPDEWLAGMEFLAQHPEERFQQVRRAQDRLTRYYSIDQLLQQVLDIFDHAKALSVGMNALPPAELVHIR